VEPQYDTRPWESGDLAFLWDMLYASIHVRPGNDAPPRSVLDEPDIAHYLSAFGELDGDDAEVAMVDGVPVGAAFCRRLPTHHRGYGFVGAHIPEVGMAVQTQYRGRGIGARLLTALVRRHPTISLSVDRDNTGAHALYRRFGFVEVGDDGNSLTMLHRPPSAQPLALRTPDLDALQHYRQAIIDGWQPDTFAPAESAARQLAEIDADPSAFLRTVDDPHADGPPIPQPDGTFVQRLPGFHRWMWDGEFCGRISIRWTPGSVELPPYCLGHIGYFVVPWKQRLGYGTRALGLLLDEVRDRPHPTMVLPYVELTTDVRNEASQRVIRANGGELVEQFVTPAGFGARPTLRFRIQR
jgi:predicted acetyltransferase/ribosomal protein S18 acetylase RimI-like enzyme